MPKTVALKDYTGGQAIVRIGAQKHVVGIQDINEVNRVVELKFSWVERMDKSGGQKNLNNLSLDVRINHRTGDDQVLGRINGTGTIVQITFYHKSKPYL